MTRGKKLSYPMKKILVVEDEESLRLLYEEELRAEGYEVLTAGNGREAIRQYVRE